MVLRSSVVIVCVRAPGSIPVHRSYDIKYAKKNFFILTMIIYIDGGAIDTKCNYKTLNTVVNHTFNILIIFITSSSQ